MRINTERRRKLRRASELTDEAYRLVESAMMEERMALDNTPENMQDTDRYAESEEAVENMEDALADLEIARDAMHDLVS